MTGIETISIEGWGGHTEVRGPRVYARYAPGIFEMAELATSALAVGTALAGTAIGFTAGFLGWTALALACHGAAGIALVAAIGAWLDAFRGLLARGNRHVHLGEGWVAIPHDVRELRDATLDVESARFTSNRSFSRLALVFADGLRIPLTQGPSAQVENVVFALQNAPCFKAAEPARPERAVAA